MLIGCFKKHFLLLSMLKTVVLLSVHSTKCVQHFQQKLEAYFEFLFFNQYSRTEKCHLDWALVNATPKEVWFIHKPLFLGSIFLYFLLCLLYIFVDGGMLHNLSMPAYSIWLLPRDFCSLIGCMTFDSNNKIWEAFLLFSWKSTWLYLFCCPIVQLCSLLHWSQNSQCFTNWEPLISNCDQSKILIMCKNEVM